MSKNRQSGRLDSPAGWARNPCQESVNSCQVCFVGFLMSNFEGFRCFSCQVEMLESVSSSLLLGLVAKALLDTDSIKRSDQGGSKLTAGLGPDWAELVQNSQGQSTPRRTSESVRACLPDCQTQVGALSGKNTGLDVRDYTSPIIYIGPEGQDQSGSTLCSNGGFLFNSLSPLNHINSRVDVVQW